MDSGSDDAAKQDLAEISQKWGLSPNASQLPYDNLFEEIVRELARRVEVLMNRDPRKFNNELYRLDVSEMKIKEVLRTRKGDAVFEGLARIILERELQKARTRREYAKT